MSKHKVITDSEGQGDTIVLLHGFLASSSYWKRLQGHLKRAGYRVVTIDLLGFGNATKYSALAYDYTEHVDHIHQHLESLNLNKPFILVGHSMGALLAARYASSHPHIVKTVFLLHPPIYKDRKEARETLRNTGKYYRFLLDSRFRNIGWYVLKRIPISPIGNHSSISREMSLANVIESTELIKDLGYLQTKTILVVGKRDRAEYLKNLTDVELNENVLLKIEDISHHSPIFRPKLITQTIVQLS